MTEYHVAKRGSYYASGLAGDPFSTIGEAARVAVAGDQVVVHEGVYREWVDPRHAGLSDKRRIVFQAAPGEHVVIKGSESVVAWVREAGEVWRVSLPNDLFGDFNPYALAVEGDWVVERFPGEPVRHLGDVYLNGRSLYEAASREELDNPPRRTAVKDDWTGIVDPIADPDQTRRVWYAEVDEEDTTIWANFGQANPNAELVEVNVRPCVFYPSRTGRDYITVRGFELAQAACPWAPPTADQPGLIGPNWAKGWVIEDNVIHDAKCSAVSIGKEASTGENNLTRRRDKPGYQYQVEAVFAARGIGWAKERVGSHVIRRNTIYDCGQNAIVGHLGGVFSRICDNHIFNIALKREFFGHEIAGIKLHAAIDVEISHNLIHDCSLGVWLDWQAQGTRVARNILFGNDRDLFVEVSHGPYAVDHNIFASRAAVELASQGGAFVGNLVGGTLRLEAVMNRATPYHVPHSTEVAGYAVVHGGDDRWVGNVFLGPGGDPADVGAAYAPPPAAAFYGTARYDGHPASFEAYLASVEAALPGDLDAVIGLKQPVYLARNLYLNGAAPYAQEDGAVVAAAPGRVRLEQADDAVWLAAELPPEFGSLTVPIQGAATLERVRLADADFEAPDGSPLVMDMDLTGAKLGPKSVPGPIAALRPGANRVRLWPLTPPEL
ncbi:MAG: right-handed parallel beta-helix repeat-containing protein [Bifidobacteriaceae bacterium]|jgi:hypothetical protein|nr:right-handed parallel beta-helix repeat-containing protein [Bifidobacteriaceae bacterium]